MLCEAVQVTLKPGSGTFWARWSCPCLIHVCCTCVRGADPVGLIAGIRLLQAMGWRQGKGVGPSRAAPGQQQQQQALGA